MQVKLTTVSKFLTFMVVLLMAGCADMNQLAIDYIDGNRERNRKGIDQEIGEFKVCNNSRSQCEKHFTMRAAPVLVPKEVFHYGYKELIGLNENHPYYSRIIRATRKGISRNGCAGVTYRNIDRTPMYLVVFFNKEYQQLVFDDALSSKTYAVDLKDYLSN